MRRASCRKIMFAACVGAAVWVACSSHAPAIPAVPKTPQPVAATPVSLPPAPADSARADYFTAKILPLVAKCRPCHFKGGKMYARLPFDDTQTIRRLGEKIFSRIQDKNEQAVFRAFFAPAADSTELKLHRKIL